MLPGNVEHQLDGRSPRQHAGRTNTRPSREYPGLASTRSPTYAHRQRRRSAGALHPEGARSPGTSSTSSMGAVPGSAPDEPILEYGTIVWSGLYEFKKTAQDDIIYR